MTVTPILRSLPRALAILLTLLALAAWPGCAGMQQEDIGPEFAWLAGTWKLLDAESDVFESWVLEGAEWQGEWQCKCQGEWPCVGGCPAYSGCRTILTAFGRHFAEL